MIAKFSGRYHCFSNFYLRPIILANIVFPSSEHLFHVFKTTKVNERQWIINAKSPGQAKFRGGAVTLRKDWDYKWRDKIMFQVCLLKFKQHIDIRKVLIDTGDEYLIEGNYHHDNYWGNCLCDRCKHLTAMNRLGITLMKVRDIMVML